MPYFSADARLIADLGSRLEEAGLPFALLRKNKGIVNAIEMQVEDEYAAPAVTAALFECLLLSARSIGTPAGDALCAQVEACRDRVAKSLAARPASGS